MISPPNLPFLGLPFLLLLPVAPCLDLTVSKGGCDRSRQQDLAKGDGIGRRPRAKRRGYW